MKIFFGWLLGILMLIAVTAYSGMFVGGELEKAGFERLAADPTTELFEGREYYNTSTKTKRVYDGTSWSTVGGGGGGGASVYSEDLSVAFPHAVDNAKGPLVDGDITFANAAYYPLDGDAVNSASLGGNLTASGSQYYTSEGFFGRTSIPFITGVSSDFGSSDAHFDMAGENFVAGGWFKSVGTTSDQALFGKYDHPNNQRSWGMLYRHGGDGWGYLDCLASADGTASQVLTTYVRHNDWFHAAIKSNPSGTVECYINGDSFGAYIVSGGLHASTSEFSLGTFNNVDSLIGHVQDFFVTREALTEAQILNIFSKRFSNPHLGPGHKLVDDDFRRPLTSQRGSFFNYEAGFYGRDDSVNSEDSTCNAVVAEVGINGGDAVRTSGSNSYCAGGGSILISSSVDSYTIGSWIKNNDDAVNSVGVDSFGMQGGLRLEYQTDGYLEVAGSGIDSDFNLIEMRENEWVHIAVSYNKLNKEANVYENGILVGTNVFSGSATPSAWFIGTTDVNDQSFDETFVVAWAMSPDEIRKIYSAKINHAASIVPDDQNWSSSLWKNENLTLQQNSYAEFMVDMELDDVYIDARVPIGSLIRLKLEEVQ